MTTKSEEKQLNINFSDLRAYNTGLLQGKAYQKLYLQLTTTLAPYKLTVPEWKLLGQLHEHGSMRLAELAGLLSYDPPMVTKLAKSLEKNKYIKRTHDKKDERAKVIAITSMGSDCIMTCEGAVKKSMALLLQGISREELAIYIKVLIKIASYASE